MRIYLTPHKNSNTNSSSKFRFPHVSIFWNVKPIFIMKLQTLMIVRFWKRDDVGWSEQKTTPLMSKKVGHSHTNTPPTTWFQTLSGNHATHKEATPRQASSYYVSTFVGITTHVAMVLCKIGSRQKRTITSAHSFHSLVGFPGAFVGMHIGFSEIHSSKQEV